MITLKFLYLISFTLAIFLDYFIKNNYLGLNSKIYYLRLMEMSFLSISVFLFSIIFALLTIFNWFDVYLFYILDENIFNFDSYSHILENNDSTDTTSVASNNKIGTGTINSSVSGHVNEGTVNVNSPGFNFSLSSEGINNLAAAASSAGGAALGFKVARQIGGPPVIKAAVGLGVMGVVQTGTAIMSKVLNNNNDNNNKFIDNIFNDSNTKELNNVFSDYPLNLLPEINKLVNIEILFLSIILNIFIVDTLTKFNYVKYIPNNRIGKLFSNIMSRYIAVWSKSRIYLIIISWISLYVCIILSKVCLYIIFNT